MNITATNLSAHLYVRNWELTANLQSTETRDSGNKHDWRNWLVKAAGENKVTGCTINTESRSSEELGVTVKDRLCDLQRRFEKSPRCTGDQEDTNRALKFPGTNLKTFETSSLGGLISKRHKQKNIRFHPIRVREIH